MKLKPPQVKKLVDAIMTELQQKHLITVLSSESKIRDKIASVILVDLKTEDDIEAQARRIMEQFRSKVESGEIDYQEMYRRVKNQLIKDKKFVI